MEGRIAGQCSWKITDGDFVSGEKTYEDRHKELVREEEKTTKGLFLSLAVLAIPAVLLILSIAAKIKI